LINENISIEENSISENLIVISEENENLPSISDNINLENILKFDFKDFVKIESNFISQDKFTNFCYNEKICENKDQDNFLLGKKRNREEDFKENEENKEHDKDKKFQKDLIEM